MDDYPPGLTKRRMFQIDRGRVIVEEHWNIDTPGCPMIRNPWALNPIQVHGSQYVRQVEMTEEEYRNSKIPLFG